MVVRPQLSQTDVSPQSNIADEPTLLRPGQCCELVDAILDNHTETMWDLYSVLRVHLDLGVVRSHSKSHQTKWDRELVQDVDMYF